MSFIVEIKVVPSSGRRECKREGDRLKCYLKSPAEKGKANRELLEYLAKTMKLSHTMVTLVTGATSRIKRIRIDADMDFKKMCGALGIAWQEALF